MGFLLRSHTKRTEGPRSNRAALFVYSFFTVENYLDPAFGDPRAEPRHAALVWRGS